MQGEEMRATRKAAGMTQQDLADAIGMSRVSIGLMERGETPIERRTELAVRYVAMCMSDEDHEKGAQPKLRP